MVCRALPFKIISKIHSRTWVLGNFLARGNDTMEPIKTEILVLGAGPGGYAAAFYAADRNKKVILVEQNARLALQAAHRGYVLESGTIGLSGPAQELLHDPRVREAYLGETLD